MEFCVKLLSLPLWERGLKLYVILGTMITDESLPLWERGLKCISVLHLLLTGSVAPLVGAWIEIIQSPPIKKSQGRRSPCGSVD